MHVIKRWHQSMYQEDDVDAYDKEVDISVCTKEVNISAQSWLSSMKGKAPQGGVNYGQSFSTVAVVLFCTQRYDCGICTLVVKVGFHLGQKHV